MQGPRGPITLVRGRYRVVGHQMRAPATTRRLRLRAHIRALDPAPAATLQRRRRALRRHLNWAPRHIGRGNFCTTCIRRFSCENIDLSCKRPVQ